jgi:hypothetical protein
VSCAPAAANDYKDALLFVSARSPIDLHANLAELCNPLVLNLPEWNQPEEMSRLAAVLRWLSTHSGWLLILDNADTSEAAAEIEKTLPHLQGGDVIITSRVADWSAAVQPVELDVLAEEDAAAFLLERTESRRKKMLTDSEDAAAVPHDLGSLALALEQGGAYVAKNSLSFSEYRQRWESRKAEVLAWYDKRLMNYPSSVAVTWQTTIEELSQSERKLLNILAWLAPAHAVITTRRQYRGRRGCSRCARRASFLEPRTLDGRQGSGHGSPSGAGDHAPTASDNERHDTLDLAVALVDRALGTRGRRFRSLA